MLNKNFCSCIFLVFFITAFSLTAADETSSAVKAYIEGCEKNDGKRIQAALESIQEKTINISSLIGMLVFTSKTLNQTNKNIISKYFPFAIYDFANSDGILYPRYDLPGLVLTLREGFIIPRERLENKPQLSSNMPTVHLLLTDYNKSTKDERLQIIEAINMNLEKGFNPHYQESKQDAFDLVKKIENEHEREQLTKAFNLHIKEPINVKDMYYPKTLGYREDYYAYKINPMAQAEILGMAAGD